MSRSRHHGCNKSPCAICRPHKRYPRKGAKRAQYEKPAVRRALQEDPKNKTEER